MPHVIVDYSPNLDGPLDMTALCEHLRATAADIDALPMPGIRVRAHRADHAAIADGADHHGFIDIAVRLRGGRPQEVKEDIARRLFQAAEEFTADYMATNLPRPLA